MKFNPQSNHRILVIDDVESVHNVFRRILIGSSIPKIVHDKDAAVFGSGPVLNKMPIFEIDSAFNGEVGLGLIEKSLLENRPYSWRSSMFVWVQDGTGCKRHARFGNNIPI
jgi:hypothetical protein